MRNRSLGAGSIPTTNRPPAPPPEKVQRTPETEELHKQIFMEMISCEEAFTIKIELYVIRLICNRNAISKAYLSHQNNPNKIKVFNMAKINSVNAIYEHFRGLTESQLEDFLRK